MPYRDSKLTSILKQSIGGNSYSLIVACINPNDQFVEENLSTLTYATKASYITNQPVINDDPRNKLIGHLKSQVRHLNDELAKANQHLDFVTSLNNELNTTQTNFKNTPTNLNNTHNNPIAKINDNTTNSSSPSYHMNQTSPNFNQRSSLNNSE